MQHTAAPLAPTRDHPQQGRERLILTPPAGWLGTPHEPDEMALLKQLNPKAVMMMGDNPALPQMPEKPTLRDFFELRFGAVTRRHLTVSAKRALDDGQSEHVVMACLLHDISNGALIRCDHGYWSAQLVAPYVSAEVAWAVQHHQALRYFPDLDAGYAYPASYDMFFGPDFEPPAYLRADAEAAMAHEWYKTARAVTLYDTYFFDDFPEVDWVDLAGVIERNFRQPAEGLGFDGSPTAHMWRTMIWPNNFL